MRVCEIGGQGVLEGVMMRGSGKSALAVRKKSKEITLKESKFVSKTKSNKFYGLPIIRGVVAFIETMFAGVGTINDALVMFDDETDEVKPSKFEEFIAEKTGKSSMDVMMFFAVVLALGFSILLFFILPNFVTGLVSKSIDSSILKNLIEGAVRLTIFVLYVLAISFVSDVKRLFMYHGAEHKVINCYEHEKELTVENAKSMTTLNPRCGTSFLLIVMVIAILFFSLFGWSSVWYVRILIRLTFLPVVAGISYEILKLLAKSENIFVRILRAPGMALQRLTTSEPDEEMVEVAMLAFRAVEGSYTKDDIEALRIDFSHGAVKTCEPEEDNDEVEDQDNQTKAVINETVKADDEPKSEV
jgi:uncharacterized protein YqhQ